MKVESVRNFGLITFSDVRVALEDLRQLLVRRGDGSDERRPGDGDGRYFQCKNLAETRFFLEFRFWILENSGPARNRTDATVRVGHGLTVTLPT